MIKSRKSCWKYDTAHAWHYWLARRSDECAEQCYKRVSWINRSLAAVLPRPRVRAEGNVARFAALLARVGHAHGA